MTANPLLAAGLAVACFFAAPAGWAQQPAFDLVVRAPGPLKELLEKHLELRRYREVTDLDDAEIARLIVLADKDARELLATQGYFAPQVRIEREAGDRPTLVVAVEPGPPAQVADVKIEFEGDIATSNDPDAVAQRQAIGDNWELPAGTLFTQSRWDDAKAGTTRRVLARRYPAGRISYSLADVDAASQSARLGIKVDSGPVFRLGPIKVTGIERYQEVLIPRLARLPEGMVYDQEKIVQAQLRIAGSGYFESAFIFVDPEADPNAAPVQVTVREAPLQKLVLGVGFTTDGGPRLTAEHTHNRLPAIGWRAVTKLQAERRNPFAQTEWTAVPDADYWRWAVQARAERLDDDRIVTYSQRLRVGQLKNDDHIDRNVYVQYERSNVNNPRNVTLTPLETGDGSAVSVNYVWTGRYFDSLPFPNDGHGWGFEVGGGITLDGERRPFQRTLVRWLGYRPLQSGRIQLRAEGGAVFAKDDARLPATQLFRTGGQNTVRGYKYLDIGVPLGDDLVGPGRYMAVGSVEWQRPILREGRPSDLESTLFVDVGSVADRVQDMRASVGVGAGVRWKSPIGPVEGSLAYGIQARKVRLHFSAGFVF